MGLSENEGKRLRKPKDDGWSSPAAVDIADGDMEGDG